MSCRSLPANRIAGFIRREALISAGTAGLVSESIVLCYQIRTLDKQRLIRKFGTISDAKLQSEILAALKFQIEIK
jgi:mRNA interferase MazF